METDQQMYSDARRQAILQSFLKKINNQLCPSGNLAVELCTNLDCKLSLKCTNLMCPFCGPKVHKGCLIIPLEQMTRLINKKAEETDKFMEILALEEDFMKKVKRVQAEFTWQLVEGGVNKDGQTRSHHLSQQQIVTDNHHPNNMCKVQTIITVSLSLSKIDSNVLHRRGSVAQDLQFIRKALNNPKALKLIFRASEYKFKAKQFHKYCDNINDTFVLIRTEYGKTIAGYSHYKWNEVDCAPVDDKGRRTFLLQMDLKKILKPLSDKYLIICSKDDGPIFGGDLHIENNCNTVRQYNWCRPGSNYNVTEGKPFEFEDYNASRDMCGCPVGYAFKVLEYEVYRVLW